LQIASSAAPAGLAQLKLGVAANACAAASHASGIPTSDKARAIAIVQFGVRPRDQATNTLRQSRFMLTTSMP